MNKPHKFNQHGSENIMHKRCKAALLALAAVPALTLTACSTDADVASRNLPKSAEQFEVDRRIVFYNGITDEYMLEITGKCSIEPEDRKLMVTCKTGPDEFKKHYLGLSDNVTYMAEHLEGTSASTDQYRVIFKPEALVPNVDRP